MEPLRVPADEIVDDDGGFRAAMAEFPDGTGRLTLWHSARRPVTGEVDTTPPDGAAS